MVDEQHVLYKWGMASSAACECGAEAQTVDHDHAVLQFPIHRPPHGQTFPYQPTLNTPSTGSSGCFRSDRFG